jgi:phosphoglycolate phosphatase
MSKYKYILFDLDGTLTDPKVGITKSIQYALAKFDIRVENLEELEKFIGPPLSNTFNEAYSFTDEKTKDAIKYYREYFSDKGIFENEVYEDIPKLLGELKNRGYVLALATSKPIGFAERIVEHFKLDNYFSLIGGSEFDGTRSAKAEVIQYVFEKLRITDLTKVLMIGDRKHDIIGGKENSIDTLGVAYGYGSLEELQEAAPTYISRDVMGILDIVG